MNRVRAPRYLRHRRTGEGTRPPRERVRRGWDRQDVGASELRYVAASGDTGARLRPRHLVRAAARCRALRPEVVSCSSAITGRRPARPVGASGAEFGRAIVARQTRPARAGRTSRVRRRVAARRFTGVMKRETCCTASRSGLARDRSLSDGVRGGRRLCSTNDAQQPLRLTPFPLDGALA